MVDVQFAEHLFGAQLKVPRLVAFHLLDEFLQPGVPRRGEALFVAADEFGQFARSAETGIDNGLFGVEDRRLFEDGDGRVLSGHDGPVVVVLPSGEDGEQGGFARTVVGDEPHLLSLGYAKTDVVEEFQCAEAFGEVLYVE